MMWQHRVQAAFGSDIGSFTRSMPPLCVPKAVHSNSSITAERRNGHHHEQNGSHKPISTGTGTQQYTRTPVSTIIEPFRVKVVEPLHRTTYQERQHLLEPADFNLFKLRAEDVLIDFLTDSGTGAMSTGQWSGIMRGDESYAGAQSWFRFQAAVRDLTGFEHVLPTHQGRGAERILFSGLDVAGKRIIANTHFDTTRANGEFLGGSCIDIPKRTLATEDLPFKGNMDLERLRQLLAEGEPVACVIMTITNNSGGGQPVSLQNIQEVSEICKRNGVPFILDACRFAENAYFIKTREQGHSHRSVKSIAQEMFALADGATFSAKKDGLANIGGFLLVRDPDLVESCRQNLILTEGYITYGGLAGRDLDAIAVGLEEVVDESYLEYRIASTRFLGQGLADAGIPVLWPPGGHAIYINASAFLPHIPAEAFPGHAVACAFYLEGGVRSCEIGSLMFGGKDPLAVDGGERKANLELCRLAIPRRVYTQSHIEYVLEIAQIVAAQKDTLRGFKIVQQPRFLRHFSASLAPTHSSANGAH
ncbi:hypothetical protein CVIRNUC_002907 [Coccomyxa viridis]|uniref:Aromatic amino acid beta-eliminating lyase/threonine aldolase domain-containing protein n=1 Tax=Coccomyxa viridis TaxID=1274662 RepID=A0AAV1HY77_9CHLO|nr:hypothetical protein CVIRNUC_002907 [Coccomyxa viridis]